MRSTRFLAAVALLWLAGNALRLTILAVPPVMQMIKADLNLSATEVGVLASIPVILFAAAALPGSLLIARFGPVPTLVAGLLVSAVASGLRGASPNAVALDAATVLIGFGVAIMQPAMPALARSWLPDHIGFGTAVYTNGLLVGEILPVALTVPVVLPLTGGSWRLSLVVWGLPILAIALCVVLFAPRSKPVERRGASGRPRWWPDWSNGLIWRIGLIFGSVNSIYFATNAFIPVYLSSQGRDDAIAPALTALNFGQLPASLLLLVFADRIAGRGWPYAVAGMLSILGVAGLVVTVGTGTIVAAACVGFACAGILVLTLALPPLLFRPEDVASTTAAMFTMSYGCAVVTPIVSGAIWDLTAVPVSAFVPMGFWAVLLLALAPALNLRRREA